MNRMVHTHLKRIRPAELQPDQAVFDCVGKEAP